MTNVLNIPTQEDLDNAFFLVEDFDESTEEFTFQSPEDTDPVD